MASVHCFKPANETCQQKCLESCYAYNKPNDTGSYYSGQSMASHQNSSASYGQTYCPDMAKPNNQMNSYGQNYGHHMITDQCHSMAKPGPTHNHGMGQAHGQYHHGHNHGHVGQQYGSHGNGTIGSSNGKSHHEKKADCYNKKKKDKSHKMKNKHKDCNRSCGDSSDDSDSDCN